MDKVGVAERNLDLAERVSGSSAGMRSYGSTEDARTQELSGGIHAGLRMICVASRSPTGMGYALRPTPTG